MPNTSVRAAAEGMPAVRPPMPSFVKTRKRRPDLPKIWWDVKPTGDYIRDCKTGYRLAFEFMAYQAVSPYGAPVLQIIAKAMPRDLTGIEIGFFSMIGLAAAAGAAEARRVWAYWDSAEGKI